MGAGRHGAQRSSIQIRNTAIVPNASVRRTHVLQMLPKKLKFPVVRRMPLQPKSEKKLYRAGDTPRSPVKVRAVFFFVWVVLFFRREGDGGSILGVNYSVGLGGSRSSGGMRRVAIGRSIALDVIAARAPPNPPERNEKRSWLESPPEDVTPNARWRGTLVRQC